MLEVQGLFSNLVEKMTIKERIERKLTTEFAPHSLEVIDESELHRGHSGYLEGGETHFRVVMRSSALKGLSRIAQQRAVMACVGEEMHERVHALALDVSG